MYPASVIAILAASVISGNVQNGRAGTIDNAAGSARSTTASKAAKQSTDSEKWPGRVTGQVVDGTGAPVERVTVRFGYHLYPMPSSGQPQGQHLNALNASRLPAGTTSGMKKTDALGNFSMNFNTSGTAVLYIDHEPYVRTLQKVTLPAEGLRIQLKKEGGATAEGRVLNLATGEPVPGADVALSMYEDVNFWSDRLGTQTLPILGGYERLKTDENGRYTIDRMPPVEVSLEGWSDQVGPSVPGKMLMTEDPMLVAGKATVLPDFYVFPGYTLRGYVRDWHTSQPVVGVTVGLLYVGHLIGSNSEDSVTDENGYYELKGMRPRFSEPRGGRPAGISFSLVNAMKDGYNQQTYMPRIEGEFDPKNLVMEHDFRINTQKKGESGMRSGMSGGTR